MTLEKMIEEARIRDGTVDQRLAEAQERMRQTNIRLGKWWRDQEVTTELLERVYPAFRD